MILVEPDKPPMKKDCHNLFSYLSVQQSSDYNMQLGRILMKTRPTVEIYERFWELFQLAVAGVTSSWGYRIQLETS
jgi:hypothetical protein